MEHQDKETREPLREEPHSSVTVDHIPDSSHQPKQTWFFHITTRPQLLASIAGALLSTVWLVSRMSPGLAFSAWQASLLSPYCSTEAQVATLITPAPMINSLIAIFCQNVFPTLNAVFLQNLITVAAGICCCTCAAFLGASFAKKIGLPDSGLQLLAGFEAALLLTLSPLMSEEATAASPGPFTASLALIAVVLATVAVEKTSHKNILLLVLSGFLCGIATANHPSFSLFVFLMFLSILLTTRPENPGIRHALWFGVASLPGVFLPVVLAVIRKESLRQFLNHALRTPYVTLGDAPPQSGFADIIAEQIPYGLLGFALVGTALLFLASTRGIAWFWFITFAVLGPFLPFLTNHYGSSDVTHDTTAPLLLVLTSVSLFSAMGAVLVIELVCLKSPKWHVRSICHFLLCLSILLIMGPRAPSRNHPLAESIARACLNSCPNDTILISDDDVLTSMLLTTQAVHQYRCDVDIVPARALALSFVRPKLIDLAAERYVVSSELSVAQKLDVWRFQQPWLVEEFVGQTTQTQENGRVPSIKELALWEFLRDNAPSRPIGFLACSRDWVSARAHPSGLILVFPATEPYFREHFQLLDTFIRQTHEVLRQHRDFAAARSVAAIIVPLSANARKNDDLENARKYASAAADMFPQSTEAQLASLKAIARAGKRDEALAQATSYLSLTRGKENPEKMARIIQQELEVAAYEEHMYRLLLGYEDSTAWYKHFTDLTSTLWRNYEFKKLTDFYLALLEEKPEDAFVLYQLAATYAQLGDSNQSNSYLLKAMEIAPNLVAANLRQDGRFALFQPKGKDLYVGD
ncbi:MAG TPA: hypothetical protein PKY35_12350 [Candidatus Hydrogenedentes bacterium]|nr:hypothetical protein [Candidatus Hydrogenedentota bacterium]HOL77809.1 hypothetical protein [Candidatus Hydrogenedentota bacterium]HPO86871.1 hypothetical protein [Candidatus Hydrogenedentota bacterium]